MRLLTNFNEIVPSRTLNHLYIYLDIVFLVLLGCLLLWRKKYITFFFGLAGGILYFLVDYGIFYLLLHTRTVEGASYFWFLLWLSMSYGFTNFVWIWLWLNKDEHLWEWSILIPMGWITVALLAQNFGQNTNMITISRGTTSYHGIMAILLLIGYLLVIVHNLKCKKEQKWPILWMLAIGILVQFSWEFVLLITGIRAVGLGPLIINSLIETNLGIPYLFFIHKAVTSKYQEDLKKKDSFCM